MNVRGRRNTSKASSPLANRDRLISSADGRGSARAREGRVGKREGVSATQSQLADGFRPALLLILLCTMGSIASRSRGRGSPLPILVRSRCPASQQLQCSRPQCAVFVSCPGRSSILISNAIPGPLPFRVRLRSIQCASASAR